MFEAIKDRRSVRAFKSKPVSEEFLVRILEAAQWAPSAGNCQARDFIIVNDFNVKRRLCDAALGQSFIEEAPIDLVVCANEERSSRRYGDRGRELYCLLDAASAVQNILLAIHALGLGACWVGAFHDANVTKNLNLPRWLRPVAIIPIGYPAEKPRTPSRMGIKAFVHLNHYGERIRPWRQAPSLINELKPYPSINLTKEHGKADQKTL